MTTVPNFSASFVRWKARAAAPRTAAEWAALATRGHRLSYMPLCTPRRYRVWGGSNNTFTIRNSTFVNNTAKYQGGAIAMPAGGSGTIAACDAITADVCRPVP